MSESPSESDTNHNCTNNMDVTVSTVPEIPIEIVSEEEMALIEAAFAAARSLPSPSSLVPSISSLSRSSPISGQLQRNVRSIRSITALSKKRILSSGSAQPDIEDSGNLTQKKTRVVDSLLHRFRKNRGLSVTDITATEWCEKQMEYVLLLGKRKPTKAMQKGSARHTKLEQEVIKKVKLRVESIEDSWAVKFINFITGANQLLFDGLTRELQLIGFIEGVWMIGIIDEIRMPITETDRSPTLVDTKTRVRDALPSEPQRRNGRLQLMCYKYLWDNLVADNFPTRKFFDFFGLNPNYILSEEIRKSSVDSGFPAQTLDDVVRNYRNTFRNLPVAHDQLLLRYELQKDYSVIGEDQFAYDSDWLQGQIQGSLAFWKGEREANYIAEEERWKCKYCQFSSVCPAAPADTNFDTSGSPSPTNMKHDSAPPTPRGNANLENTQN